MMAEAESTVSELAEANKVRVLESNVLHASDVIYWLNGASAENEAAMQRVPYPLQVRFTEKPRNVNVLHGNGRMALWRNPEQAIIAGRATEAQRSRPSMPAFTVAGEVRDPFGRFNPGLFSVTLGAGNGVAVLLYPSLLGTGTVSAGVLQGSLQFAGSGLPVAWALLELQVALTGSETLIFRAQADAHGDFRMALRRLPPLPESITAYGGSLRVHADVHTSSSAVPDISGFVAMNLESSTSAGDFQAELNVEIHPGESIRIGSFNKKHLSIQTA